MNMRITLFKSLCVRRLHIIVSYNRTNPSIWGLKEQKERVSITEKTVISAGLQQTTGVICFKLLSPNCSRKREISKNA